MTHIVLLHTLKWHIDCLSISRSTRNSLAAAEHCNANSIRQQQLNPHGFCSIARDLRFYDLFRGSEAKYLFNFNTNEKFVLVFFRCLSIYAALDRYAIINVQFSLQGAKIRSASDISGWIKHTLYILSYIECTAHHRLTLSTLRVFRRLHLSLFNCIVGESRTVVFVIDSGVNIHCRNENLPWIITICIWRLFHGFWFSFWFLLRDAEDQFHSRLLSNRKERRISLFEYYTILLNNSKAFDFWFSDWKNCGSIRFA